MSTIESEFDYIQESRSKLSEALTKKFGVREQDIMNTDGTIKAPGLWKVKSDGKDGYVKDYLKRLYDWAVVVTATNVHTDGSLTFKKDGTGDVANTVFNGSEDKSISYNSIGAAASVHTHIKAQITDFPDSLKNPKTFTVFGVGYDGSEAKSIDPRNLISVLDEGTSQVTDGTMLLTSYASKDGFAQSNAKNVLYKRNATQLWKYIQGKTDILYVSKLGIDSDTKTKLTWTVGTTTNSLEIPYATTSGTASKLATSITLWGQSFNGTSDVSGDITNAGNIFNNSAGTYQIGDNSNDYAKGYFRWIGASTGNNLVLAAGNVGCMTLLTTGNVGIGVTTPTYKLCVSGNVYTTSGFIKKDSSDYYVLLGNGGHKQWSTSNTKNALVARDAYGFISTGYINTAITADDGNTLNYIYFSDDNYIRKMSYTQFKTYLNNDLNWGNYLSIYGGTMEGSITFKDSGSWDQGTGAQGAREGFRWYGQSDYIYLFAEETGADNLDLVLKFGDDGSNGLSVRNYSGDQTAYISAKGVVTAKALYGPLRIEADTVGIKFREDNSEFATWIAQETGSVGALLFGTNRAETSFMFSNGTYYTDLASDQFQNLTPGLTICSNKVAISTPYVNLRSGNPEYNFMVTGTSYFTDSVKLDKLLLPTGDSSYSFGSSGQVIASNGSGVYWKDLSAGASNNPVVLMSGYFSRSSYYAGVSTFKFSGYKHDNLDIGTISVSGGVLSVPIYCSSGLVDPGAILTQCMQVFNITDTSGAYSNQTGVGPYWLQTFYSSSYSNSKYFTTAYIRAYSVTSGIQWSSSASYWSGDSKSIKSFSFVLFGYIANSSSSGTVAPGETVEPIL